MRLNYNRKMTILFILISIFLLTSCTNNWLNKAPMQTAENATFGDFILQPSRVDLPQLEDFSAIKIGKTTSSEVRQLLGNPQSQDTFGFASVTYRTDDGYAVQIFFAQYGEQDLAEALETIENGEYYVYDMKVSSTDNSN